MGRLGIERITHMANNGPSFTKATYDKKSTPKPVSPERQQAELNDEIRTAAKTRRFNKLLRKDRNAALRELALNVEPPQRPLRRI
jgi:hypothetical protein